MPFSHLLIIAFGLMLVLTVLSTSYLVIRSGNRIIDSVIAKLAHYTSHDVSLEIARFLESPEVINQNTLNSIQARRVDPADLDNMSRFLWDSARSSIDFSFSSIYYASTDGTFISVGVADTHHPSEKRVFSFASQADGGQYGDYQVSPDGTIGELFEYHGEFDPRVRPWYVSATASPDQSVWSDIYTDFDTHLATLTHAMAVHDDDGKLVGVAAVDLFLEHLQEFLAELDITQSSEVFIIDSESLVVGAYAPAIDTDLPDHNIGAVDSPYPYTRDSAAYFLSHARSVMNADGGFSADVTLGGTDGHLHFVPVGRAQGVNWTMGVFIPRSDFIDGFVGQASSLLLPILLILLLAIGTIAVFIAVIVKPLKKLKSDASRIAAGQFDVAVATKSRNEVGELAQSIDSMQGRLKRSFGKLERLNKNLVEEKSRVMTTLESIEDGVIALNASDRITFMNPSAEWQTGWALSSVADKTFRELISEGIESDELSDKRELLLDTLDRAHDRPGESIRTLGPVTEENPLSCRLSPVLDAGDNQTGTVLVFNDMSDLLRLKIRHQEVEAVSSKLSRIVEEAANEIYMLEPESLSIVMLNKAARKNLRYTTEQAIKLTAFDIVQFVTKEESQRIVEPLMRGELDVQYYESFHVRKDGTTYPVEMRLHFMRDESPPVLVAIVHDITVRRRQMADLLLRDRAISEVDVGVLICDAQQPDMPIVYVNRAIEKLTGYTEEDLLGHNPRLLQGNSRSQPSIGKMRNALSEHSSVQLILQNFRKDGTEFTNELSVSPVRDEMGVTTHYIGIQKDITDRLKTESQLRHAQKIDAIGQLSGGIAHDFNNLLNIISGRLEMLESGLHDGSLRHHVDEAARAADMGARLTQRLLSFARKGTLEPTLINLNECITNTLTMLYPTIGKKITFKRILDSQLWPVRVDPSEIENSLVNLVINARDAMPDYGEIRIETKNIAVRDIDLLEDTSLNAGDYVMLSVSDTGRGMNEETLSHLFEPFYTTKLPGEGTGLGLSSVFGFAKQSGGTVIVKSVPGVGSVFQLYLPRDDCSQAAVNQQCPGSNPANTVLAASVDSDKKRRILVVEDNSGVRDVTLARLEFMGFDVEAVGSGPEAQTLFKTMGDFDLVFCDMVIPGGMNGREVADWVRQNFPDCKILLTSGFSEQSLESVSQKSSEWPILHKPYRLQDLQQRVQKLLDDA